ncbi:MAG: zinc ribbon domain-containing protein [Candidatus Omnitrophota bacterium]|nr:zinc ribbon domain-containing protein [Candidatus Omnitrophota bacterium]
MPTYEYECKTCGHAFEVSQSITAKPLEECPKCGKSVRRLISSGVGLIFKGSGFYATDYRKKSKSEKEKKGAPCQKATPECKACPHAQ